MARRTGDRQVIGNCFLGQFFSPPEAIELDEPMGATESPADRTERPGIVALALSGGTFKRSLLTGLIVGTILSAINQGDVIVAGEVPNFIKIGLNDLVPYCVATFGALTAKLHALRNQPK